MLDWITHLFPFAPPAFNIFFVALIGFAILTIILRLFGIGGASSPRRSRSRMWKNSPSNPANPLSPLNPSSPAYRRHHRNF